MKLFGKKSLLISLAVIIGIMFLFNCGAAFAYTQEGGSDNTPTKHKKSNYNWDNPYQPTPKPTPTQPVEVPSEPVVAAPVAPAAPVVAPAAPAPAAPPKELPKTGGNMLMLIFPGIALVGAGWALRRKGV